MTLVEAMRQAVGGSLARHLKEPPFPPLVRSIATDATILAANRVEAADSPLCNCRHSGNPPYSKVGRVIDHHCDCAAVRAAAVMLEGLARPLHVDQCGGCK